MLELKENTADADTSDSFAVKRATFLKRALLPATVFITGASVLVLEILATRLLAPYFGTSVYTISSILSTVLAALSLGYAAGGRLADRNPSERIFYGIIFTGGISVLIVASVHAFTLSFLSYVLPLTIGPLLSAFMLFFVPSFLMGMLSPYAIKLQSLRFPEKGIGTMSGEMFFWSTVGSIFGSLVTGFLLVPYIGINHILISIGFILSLLGLFPLGIRALRKKVPLFLVCIGIAFGVRAVFPNLYAGTMLYAKDGLYERLIVVDGMYKGRPTRFFQQDLSSAGAMYLDSDELVYDYTKYYSLHRLFTPDVARVAVLGGGVYSVPKAVLAELPGAEVDVVEIEPLLPEVAQKYFNVTENSRMHTYIQDGRRFLRDRTDGTYDLIFSDVYYSLFSIPVHFTTQEFFQTAYEKLTPGGIFIANIIGSLDPEAGRFFYAEMKTFQSVFPQTYFFAVTATSTKAVQNIIFVGHKSPTPVTLSSFRNTRYPELPPLSDVRIDPLRFDLRNYPLLTDAYAPVEHLISRLLLAQ